MKNVSAAVVETAYHAALEALTIAERELLIRAEEIVANNYPAFMAAASALRDICRGRWYRETYNSWHAYCEGRWGISGRHGYRMIQSAEAVERVEALGDVNESTARALAGFEELIQKAVYQVALATATRGSDGTPIITAAHIKAVGDQITGWVVSGGMDNGAGEMKPLGVLVKAHVTEDVYERMMRQSSHIREKLEAKNGDGGGSSQNGVGKPSEPLTRINASKSILGVVPAQESGNGSSPEPLPDDPTPTQWVKEPLTVPASACSTGQPERLTRALEQYLEIYKHLQEALQHRQPLGSAAGAGSMMPSLMMIKVLLKPDLGHQLIVERDSKESDCDGCEREGEQTNLGHYTIVENENIYSRSWHLCQRCLDLYLAVMKIAGGVFKDERA